MKKKLARSAVVVGITLILAVPYQAEAVTVLDQSFTSPTNLGATINDCCKYVAQTFTAGVSGTLAGVTVDVASFTGDYPLHVAIHTVTGGVPTSTILGETTLSTPDAPLTLPITFTQVIESVAGTQYAIVVDYEGAPPPSPPDAQGTWSGATGDVYTGGALYFSVDGTSWFLSGPDHDVHFTTHVNIRSSIVRVSVAPDGGEGNGDSLFPSISPGGRYVAFQSYASNLVTGDTNGYDDAFVFDLATGRTTRVSVAFDGSQPNGSSWPSQVSASGRFVVFSSIASNLVEGDTNNVWDVFVRDLLTGQNTRVSEASDGGQSDRDSLVVRSASMSADGRYVTFYSSASNLVSSDTNGLNDVFVRDLLSGEVTRVSVSSDGSEGNGESLRPTLSASGRYVAYHSSSSNLVPEDTNGFYDVFVHDRETAQTVRVSVASDGRQANLDSHEPEISGDGRYVTFYSGASNLVPSDSNGVTDAFVHDRLTGRTTRVSVATDGSEGDAVSFASSISGKGRFAVFESLAANLVAGDTNDVRDIFVRDQVSGETSRVSVASDGSEGNEASSSGSLSFSGRWVAFHSYASNLVSGDTNGHFDVFVHDRLGAEP